MEAFFFLHAETEQSVDTGTTLSLFGKDRSGKSIIVRIYGYRIHFYASFADPKLAGRCCSRLLAKGKVENSFMTQQNEDGVGQLVVSMNTVVGFQSMLLNKNHQTADETDYSDTTMRNVVRFQVRRQTDILKVIEIIDGVAREYCGERYLTAVNYYESNLDVITSAIRYLGLEACRWCFLNTGSLSKDEKEPLGRGLCFYQDGRVDPKVLFEETECAISSSDNCLPILPPPVSVMSFDIECLSSDPEKMPDAVKDSVIQISTCVATDSLGRTGCNEVRRHLFTLGGSCGEIENATVSTFDEEKKMLEAFTEHILAEDPDIVTGYNINNFDYPYLFKRFTENLVEARLGRGGRVASCEKSRHEASRQYASFIPKTHYTHIPGRISFDMYAYVRGEVGDMRSYSLNSVASRFLGRKKEDVDYREIPKLFYGGEEMRARLGRYCVTDSELVLDIAFKRQTFMHAFERCKVFRTIPQYLVERGQQVKFYSMLLAWCSEKRVLINDVTSRDRIEKRNWKSKTRPVGVCGAVPKKNVVGTPLRDEPSKSDTEPLDGKKIKTARRSGYDGATVLDPITGIYRTPVICLDYASLYPSIMIAYNLCFTTLILDDTHGRILEAAGTAEKTPVGCYFLKQSVKKGVLPTILEMLLNERADVRKRMKTLPKDSMDHLMLDGQQSALKIAANSIYGSIGSENSILNFVQIAASVTAVGRKSLLETKNCVESTFANTVVVYGDTDSVMVNLPDWNADRGDTLHKCAELGEQMAAHVTGVINRPPIKLQFETLYKPFLLCSKKRYAARVHTDILQSTRAIDAAAESTSRILYKGLQVVRRDNCTFSTRLMRTTLELLMDDKVMPVERVTTYLRGQLELLFDGRVNTKELVISKEWKKRFVKGQAHDTLARKMEHRDPNSAPSIGDRVPYVVIENVSSDRAKLCDRAEDPLYAMEKGLRLDLMYYADNRVATPVAELLRVVFKENKTLEQVKATFWPKNGPPLRRDLNKNVWTKRASVGSALVTSFFKRNPDSSVDNELVSGLRQDLVDVEDTLTTLADKCLKCKNNDSEAVLSCRNRECETLYERFDTLNRRKTTVLKMKTVKSEALAESTDNGGDLVAERKANWMDCFLK